jgi:inosine/xanthosine triphosphate pyrophosphatase family protein
MSDRLLYITANQDKILKAQEHFRPHGIEFEAVQIDIPEVRRLSLEEAAIDKAQKSYDIVQRRLIVNNVSST